MQHQNIVIPSTDAAPFQKLDPKELFYEQIRNSVVPFVHILLSLLFLSSVLGVLTSVLNLYSWNGTHVHGGFDGPLHVKNSLAAPTSLPSVWIHILDEHHEYDQRHQIHPIFGKE